MYSYFFNLRPLLKKGQRPDSFADHFEQHFDSTTSYIYLINCITFNIFKILNLIGAVKKFTKLNCNLCMEERLTILKKLLNKQVTVMNKNLEIYRA